MQPSAINQHSALRRITPTTPLPWLPDSLRRRPAPVRLAFSFSAAERRVFRKRRKIKVSEWCEKHRIVTMSSLAGPWRNKVTPYLAGIMDASFFPSVREIAICASPQSGKSEAVNNCIAYAADRDPGPVLYVYPDELTAKENCNDRIQPMFTSSRRLRETMTGRQDDATAMRINLKHMPIYMGWASSVSRLINKPIRYIAFDEPDKYQLSNRRETDPIRLGEGRKTTFRWNYKIWKTSTPSVESGCIWQALLTSQVIFEYQVVCPSCGRPQVMSFERIHWPADERDPNTIEAQGWAWYECEHCQAHWDDNQRDQAVRLGNWVAKGDGRELFAYLEAVRPRKIGFHLPSWLSPFVPLPEIAAAWLKCRKIGTKIIDLNAHKDFCNRYKAEPWLEHRQERQEDKILDLCDDRPRGLVPSGNRVACLLGTADTQDNGFYYKIRAWGYGLEQESWLIREGFVDSFEALEQVFWQDEYRDAAGKQYVLHFCAIDAMGHRTKEVYDWCRVRKGKIVPLKGEERMATPFSWSTIDTYPGTKKAIPGGVQLLRINTNYFKDNLATKLEIFPADPGAWHLHKDYTSDWAQQMCVEFVNGKGSWECPEGKANHAFDIEVYGLALADLVEVKFWKRPEEEEIVAGRRVRSKGVEV